MADDLKDLQAAALEKLDSIWDEPSLEQWRVEYLGRKGEVSRLFERLGALPREERAPFGKSANALKRALEEAFGARQGAIQQRTLSESLESEPLDVTLPGRPRPRGRIHPATENLREMFQIFRDMGFQIYRSREIETDVMNFQYLNMPPFHPARDNWSTFYVAGTDDKVLLRTHTSPGQIRAMREMHPNPIRVILPGMCYRYEQVSSRYEIQFQQLEGLVVGRDITFANLKGTLTEFARRMYGERPVRFFADHFPFTEPSAQVDVRCFVCEGKGTDALCKYTGWLEILGAGMVHPQVLVNGGYDPNEWSGFAFGMGTERIAMLKHGVPDVRYFWQDDLRFLEQY